MYRSWLRIDMARTWVSQLVPWTWVSVAVAARAVLRAQAAAQKLGALAHDVGQELGVAILAAVAILARSPPYGLHGAEIALELQVAPVVGARADRGRLRAAVDSTALENALVVPIVADEARGRLLGRERCKVDAMPRGGQTRQLVAHSHSCGHAATVVGAATLPHLGSVHAAAPDHFCVLRPLPWPGAVVEVVERHRQGCVLRAAASRTAVLPRVPSLPIVVGYAV